MSVGFSNVTTSTVEGHPNAVIIAEMLAQYYARADSMDKEERMKVLSIIGSASLFVHDQVYDAPFPEASK